MLLLVIVLLLLFGGFGGGWYGYRSGYVGPGGFGIGGVLLIVLVVWILFYGGIPMHFRY